jgi:hypothetical protein
MICSEMRKIFREVQVFSFGFGVFSVVVKVFEHLLGGLNGLRQKRVFLLGSDAFGFGFVGAFCGSFPFVVVAFVDAG